MLEEITNSVLITGAYGFVGTNISKYLKKESSYKVAALDIVERDGEYDQYFSWSDIDNIDWDNLNTVIHLAGIAHDTKNCADPQLYYKVNTELTKKVFDKFASSNCKNFIFFSSVKGIADTVVGDTLTEDVTPSPKTDYGKSKLLAEEYILSHKEVIDNPNKRVYILRPSMIHGPGNKGNLNLLYKVVSKRIPWPLGAYHNLRSFTSVDNLCYIIKNSIEKSIPSGVYNISDDEPISTNQLISIIGSALNQKTTILNINRGFIKGLAAIGDKIKLPLNSERLKKLTENYVVSNNKIKKALIIDALPISAKDGLTNTIKSFKNNK